MRLIKTYIVEDSELIRDNLIATLEELAPIEVVGTAGDEADAVRWLEVPGQQFDLLIVDIFLKTGSGLGVLAAVSHLPHSHQVVVLTNYATAEMRDRCMALGADRFFDKSDDIDALIQYCVRMAANERA